MNKTGLIPLGTVACLVVTVFASNIRGEEAASFKIVPIPKEEHGYSNFESTAITSQGDLDTFLKKSNGQDMGWNNRADFEKALAQAKLDFDRESLVLLRHTEGSGSVQINFRQPRVKERRIICQIDRKEPPEGGLGVVAFYCFALAVAKVDVAVVEMQVSGRKPIVLSITKEKESNQAPEDTARKLADPQH